MYFHWLGSGVGATCFLFIFYLWSGWSHLEVTDTREQLDDEYPLEDLSFLNNRINELGEGMEDKYVETNKTKMILPRSTTHLSTMFSD